MSLVAAIHSVNQEMSSAKSTQEMLRAGHLLSDFCPLSSPFCYRLATNPNTKNSVFCSHRTNAELYPFDELHTRRLSRRARKIGNSVFPGLGSVISRPLLKLEWKRFLAGQQPDVLHAQFGDFASVLIPQLNTNLPLVVTFHGSDVNIATQNLAYRQKLTQLFDRATICHFVSDALRNTAIAFGCSESKAKTVYLGTQIPDHQVIYSQRTDHCRFACVGRLVPCKGHDTLLTAFKRLVQKLPHCELHLYGNGYLRDSLQSRVDAEDLSSNVRFHGEINNAILLEQLRTTIDVVVLSSQTDETGRAEGLPISLTEANAMGLPCIATRCGGTSELIEHRSTGLLCDERDSATLADHMIELARNCDLRREYGQAGRLRCEQQFNASRQLDAIARLYAEAVA